MTQITVDAALRGTLMNVNKPVELCDESGRVLGQFLPALNPAAYEQTEPIISPVELESRRAEEDYTIQEVLAHLESL